MYLPRLTKVEMKRKKIKINKAKKKSTILFERL